MAAREPFNVTVRSPAVTTQRSPWHSPVPYLFGGLAAMLGLIAFALLILACSYWKLSGYLENSENDGERDLEAGEGGKGDETQKAPPVFEEKILVIMAGEAKPTFLATPISSRSSSFGDCSSTNSTTCNCGKSDQKSVEMAEQIETSTVKLEATETSSTGAENVHHHHHENNNTEATNEASTDQSHQTLVILGLAVIGKRAS